MIHILYFASIRERLGTASESVSADGLTDIGSVLVLLRQRGGVWGEVFAEGRNVMMALNQEVADIHTPVETGDEVAFFPPVTGG